MLTDAEDASWALGEMLGLLAKTCPGGWAARRPGVSAAACRTVAAPMNRVIGELPDAGVNDVADLVSQLEGDGLAYLVESRPDASPLEDWCRDRGMTASPGVPLMTCSADDVFLPSYDGVMRSLTGSQMDEHIDVATASYGMHPDALAAFRQSTLFEQSYGAGLIADVDGVPAATGISVVAGDWVGVFIIGTVDAYRRRGLGAALTAQLVVDAVKRNGVGRALLQSSVLGKGVYESLGFRTVEHWTRWTPAPA